MTTEAAQGASIDGDIMSSCGCQSMLVLCWSLQFPLPSMSTARHAMQQSAHQGIASRVLQRLQNLQCSFHSTFQDEGPCMCLEPE